VEDGIDSENKEYLGHTPTLGCCGLYEKDCHVWVSKLGEKTKCVYRIELYEIETKGHKIYVGISPKNAESIVYNALKYNLIQNLETVYIVRKKTLLNSLFDFMGKTMDDNYYICEVKSIPLADYANGTKKEREIMNFDNIEYDQNI